MNKTFKYALSTVLGLSIAMSATAQNFPDVPDNHWAYDALATMKSQGLLVGYPDGLFRGGRPATRYELAVAVHATYMHLKGITDGLQQQINSLSGGGEGFDPSGLQGALDQLRKDVDAMKGWGDSISNLQRMASTFEKELASMGVDVEAMKKDIASLKDRVTALEKNKPAVLFGGEATMFLQHGRGTSNRWGLGKDGQLVGGTADVPMSRASSFLDGVSIFHSALLTMKGTNEEGPKWNAALEIGNLLNGYGAAPGMTASASAQRNDEAPTDIAFRRLAVEFDHGLLGQAVSFKAGRLGYKVSPYIFQSPDSNPYVKSPFDNGEWTMDGAVLGFNFGPAKLNFLVGRTNGRNSNQGVDLGGIRVGGTQGYGATTLIGGLNTRGNQLTADSLLGAHLTVPLTDKGSLDLAYLIHGQNTPTGVPPSGGVATQDTVHVYGGSLNWDLNGIKLQGGVSQSKTYTGDRGYSPFNTQNTAWNVGLGYDSDRWGIAGGYRDIGRNYGAAGDWGRIGAWWNPTGIKSWNAKAWFGISGQSELWAKGEWLEGDGRTGSLPKSVDITSYKVGLNQQISEGLALMLGAEFVEYRGIGAGSKPYQRWYDLGVSYSLSDMAKLSLLWQYSDADAKTSLAWAAPGNPNGRYTGHLLTTQFTIKF